MYEEISITKLEKILRRKRPECPIIIGGCMTAIDPDRLKSVVGSTPLYLLETRRLDAIDHIIQPMIPMAEIPDPHITEFDQHYPDPIKAENYSTEAHWEYWIAKHGYKIRIDEGCLGDCSYCVAKLATQRLQSVPLPDVIAAFKEGLHTGYNSFLFTGSDTGAYGQDLGLSIVDLFTHLFEVYRDWETDRKSVV